MAASSALRVRPWPRTTPPRSVLLSASASRNISLAMNWSPRLPASLSAACSSDTRSRPGWTGCRRPAPAAARRSRSPSPSAARGIDAGAVEQRLRARRAGASMAASRWAGSMYGLSRATARLWASARACWKAVVSLSIRMDSSGLPTQVRGRPAFQGGRHSRGDLRWVKSAPNQTGQANVGPTLTSRRQCGGSGWRGTAAAGPSAHCDAAPHR